MRLYLRQRWELLVYDFGVPSIGIGIWMGGICAAVSWKIGSSKVQMEYINSQVVRINTIIILHHCAAIECPNQGM